ncbi:uroporphyrinogen-III synthase [Flavobacterium azooxidireducens]|uniref:Uroporphyrinogen-III synthase n=1 Tax=Flavobacterium azooxidireducens TaxID=1871076 RepID=A0ABY4KHP9_9FLAO|nr:uroporphyrinogen-III synthase [Flavobacterium azooxidireducens]UPQ80337.1 uroporphyrinogen-III synthase [Flavobacterium azooxidireducens]
MEKSIRILSTKKLQPNQKQFLLNADFRLIEADFIQIEFQSFQLNSSFDYLIFTSQNAVLSVIKNENHIILKDKICFCVGIKTKQLLKENGFKVENAFDYADELVDYLLKNHSDKKFTFFSGNLRRDTIPAAFQKNNIIFEEIEVYKTILTPHKTDNQIDGILFFSPSAVQSYLKENSISNEICFCIGTTTAAEIEKSTKNIVIANRPTVENVIIQSINYFKES